MALGTCAGFSKLVVGLQAVERSPAPAAVEDLVDDVAEYYETEKSCKSKSHKLTSGIPETCKYRQQPTTKRKTKKAISGSKSGLAYCAKISSITEGALAQEEPSPPHTPQASTSCTLIAVKLLAAEEEDPNTNISAM